MNSIVLVEPISSGIELVNTILSSKSEYSLIVITSNDSENSFKDERVQNIIKVQDFEYETILKELVQISEAGILIKAIIPGFEYYVSVTAKLNQYFKLDGLKYESSLNLRDKIKMKMALTKSSIGLPNWFSGKLMELEELCLKKKIEFPVVVKPSNLSGSIGVKKIDSISDLSKYVEKSFKDPFYDLNLKSEHFLIEEYLNGDEFSTEGYVDRSGKGHIISITQKQLGALPHFVELGHIVGLDFSIDFKKMVESFTQEVINGLKINTGPFHIEFRVIGNQIYFIEIGARLPGDQIVDLIKLSQGVDLAEIMIDCYLGNEVKINKNSDPKKIGVFFIQGHKGLQLKKIRIDHFKDKYSKNWVKGRLEQKEGSFINHNEDFSSRLASFILRGNEVKELNSIATDIRRDYENS